MRVRSIIYFFDAKPSLCATQNIKSSIYKFHFEEQNNAFFIEKYFPAFQCANVKLSREMEIFTSVLRENSLLFIFHRLFLISSALM